MNIYLSQLKKSITQKLENVNDAEYLATLDAILTYETNSQNGKMPNPVEKKSKRRFLSYLFF